MVGERRGVRATSGLLDLLVGGLGILGGGQEVVAFRDGSRLGTIVGAGGLLAGIFFALAGLAIWPQRSEARPLGYPAGTTSIVVYVAGVAWESSALWGLALGIAYPALVMAWLARPGSGLGRASGAERSSDGSGRDARTFLRVIAATA